MESVINTFLRNLPLIWLAAITGWLVWDQAFRETAYREEITTQRLNVVEPDGKPRMIISSKERMPLAYWRGKETSHRSHGGGGFLFFNNDGTEAGGMGFGNVRDGDKFGAETNLNFDQYEQDNTLQLVYRDDNGRRLAGLRVKDRPNQSLSFALELIEKIETAENDDERARLEAEMEALEEVYARETATRFFAGKELGDSLVSLSDKQGRPRLVMKVDTDGVASIEFMNEAGAVERRILGASPP